MTVTEMIPQNRPTPASALVQVGSSPVRKSYFGKHRKSADIQAGSSLIPVSWELVEKTGPRRLCNRARLESCRKLSKLHLGFSSCGAPSLIFIEPNQFPFALQSTLKTTP